MIQNSQVTVKYLSQDYHEIDRKFTSRGITSWGITCGNITRRKSTGHELREFDPPRPPFLRLFLNGIYLLWVPFSRALSFART